MGKSISKILFLALVASCILFVSCEEDPADIDLRDELEGTWNVTENNNLKSTEYYTVTISKSLSDTSAILIDNFYALGETVKAKLSGYNLNIPQQNVGGFTFKGYGSLALNMKKIEWSYTVDHHNGFIDQVTATYTR